MKDEDIVKYIERLGYVEGLPVVTDPGILSPKSFIDDVVYKRLPNPFMPDTPQRIATDTSQKLAIRFGETIKKYIQRGLDKENLVLIPLVLAGYARYLKGLKDDLKPFEPSPDPMLQELQQIVAPLEVGRQEQDYSCLKQLYTRKDVFGLDLYEAGLGEQIEGMVRELFAGPGAVRATLHKYVSQR
jgi:fructuronate reductase